MKSKKVLALTTSTVAVLGLISAAAHAQVSDAPAQSTEMAPKPTLEEELVHLRGMIAVQTLRLEEAEQAVKRLASTVDEQNARISSLEAELAAAGGGAAARSATAANGRRIHKVRAGDTLYRIADRYKTSVSAIMAANRIASPNRIQIGQKIVIPGDSAGSTVTVPVGPPASQPPQQRAPIPADQPAQIAQAPAGTTPQQSPASQSSGSPPEPVGQRPAEELDEPYLALASDVGGILTPKGSLFFEPEIDFSNSSENRFFFSGVEIVDAILIGAIEATDTDRMSIVGRAGFRYGVTNRLEIDAKIPWVYRDDRVAGVAIGDQTEFVRDLRGAGLGDIEIGAHYQLTDGSGFPYTIANLRAKAPTGEGPFDVDRTSQGVELDAATGSGFWTLEPSVTFILPTDPAVFYANIGYQHNFAISPDEQVGSAIVREFNPGEAIRTSLGVGLSVNERLSLNFGYDQSHFFPTTLLLETVNANTGEIIFTRARQPRVTVGSFGVGGSYYVNDRLRLNLNTSFGATDEAPDLRLLLRAQVKLFD